MKQGPFQQQSFFRRLGFAIQGLRVAYHSESSFRTQLFLGLGALGLLVALRPPAIWWAVLLLITSAVLAAELINTALEFLLDRLHPEVHPLIAHAKDCAAAAVLVLSLAALGIAGILVFSLR